MINVEDCDAEGDKVEDLDRVEDLATTEEDLLCNYFSNRAKGTIHYSTSALESSQPSQLTAELNESSMQYHTKGDLELKF